MVRLYTERTDLCSKTVDELQPFDLRWSPCAQEMSVADFVFALQISPKSQLFVSLKYQSGQPEGIPLFYPTAEMKTMTLLHKLTAENNKLKFNCYSIKLWKFVLKLIQQPDNSQAWVSAVFSQWWFFHHYWTTEKKLKIKQSLIRLKIGIQCRRGPKQDYCL